MPHRETDIQISEVIHLLGLPYPPNGRSAYYIPCPCCDSGRKKHLNINLARNVFRCPRCGFSGGILDLFSFYSGVNREDAYTELKKRLGISDEYKTSSSTRKNIRPHSKILVPEIIECPPTDIDTRSATYTALLSKLTLASDHWENLRKRGLSDDIIVEKAYRTTPAVGGKALAKQLIKEGHYLAGVPGFYRDKTDQQWTFIQPQRGILIPVRDYLGRIQGLQIRRDNVNKGKFRWISSAEDKKGHPLMDGCRSTCWIHIAGPIRKQVLLIEGPLKADIVHYLTGQTVIAVPGVNSLNQLKETLEELKKNGLQHVMTAFDMDFMYKYGVQNGFYKLIWMLHELKIPFGTYLWHPDYNGLDDYVWECLISHTTAAQSI